MLGYPGGGVERCYGPDTNKIKIKRLSGKCCIVCKVQARGVGDIMFL